MFAQRPKLVVNLLLPGLQNQSLSTQFGLYYQWLLVVIKDNLRQRQNYFCDLIQNTNAGKIAGSNLKSLEQLFIMDTS